MTVTVDAIRPGGHRRASWTASLPILVGLLVAVVASLSWVQWWRPVIEHDDWINLLPNGHMPGLDHVARVLTEGRWLNYWCWLAGEPSLSARDAVLIFAAAWLLFTAVFVRSITTSWWAVPLAVAVYASPMTSDVSYWPATLGPSMTMLALGAVLLWLTRDRLGWHLAALVLTCCLTGLGYPPFALMLAMLLIAIHHHRAWRQLAAIGATFVLSYVGTLLLVFTLNEVRFGHFGLTIASWRHPSSLSGIGSLLRHLGVAGHDWLLVLEATSIPTVLALVALGFALADRGLRRRFGVLAIGFGIALVLDVAPTILNGVNNPFRAMSWSWMGLILVVAWAAHSELARPRLVGRIVLVVIAVWGTIYWANSVLGHRRFEVVMDRIQNQTVAMVRHTHGRVVVAPWGPVFTDVEANTAQQFGNALYKENHIQVTERCLPFPRCDRLQEFALRHHITSNLFYDHGWIVVRLPWAAIGTELDVLPKPRWLEPIPWARTVQQ